MSRICLPYHVFLDNGIIDYGSTGYAKVVLAAAYVTEPSQALWMQKLLKDYGAFVDIGLARGALLHKSEVNVRPIPAALHC